MAGLGLQVEGHLIYAESMRRVPRAAYLSSGFPDCQVSSNRIGSSL